MFFTKNFEAINPKLSIKKKNVTKRQDSETELKIPLIYNKKRIDKVGDPFGISISISLTLFLYPSITI